MMKNMFWCVLIGFSIIGFLLCVHAYSYKNATADALEFHWRGLCIYAVIACAAGLGLFRGYGPVAYFILLASSISVTFVVSRVNAVAQLFVFAAVGFAIGLSVECLMRRDRKG